MTPNLRQALPQEFPDIQRGYGWPGWFRVLEEDGKATGHVAVTEIHGLPFIHDLRYWGSDPYGTVKLCLAARDRIKSDLNYDEMFVNIDPAYPDMFKPLSDHGFQVVQIIMKKQIREPEGEEE